MGLMFVAAGAIFFIFHTAGLFLFIFGRGIITLLANGAFEGYDISHRLSFRPKLNLKFCRAGDGTRTRDQQLGRL